MGETKQIKIEVNANSKNATSQIKKLNSEIKHLQRQGKLTTQSLKNQTQQIDQTTRSFASLTKHVSQLAIIYGAFQGMQTTIRTFAQFEASITRLGVISGATREELSELEQTAKHLGETTIFTGSQVADGMNAMAMAGLSASESLDGIASVLDLSAVGLVSVEEASLIATTAMNGFGLEANDIGRITDLMAKTITTSATTVTELGNAYEKVGAVSNTFNVSIETTTAALGTLADAGRRGSEAGTQLKIVMSRLAGNKEAAKYIKELGADIYDANGNTLPFIEQLSNVKTQLDKLSEQQRNLKMAEIFGTEALASASILLGSIDEVIAKTAELGNAYGFASTAAKKMMDNLTGDYLEFQSALEGLIINIGEELSPVLRQALDEATEFLQTLDPDEVKNFGEGVGELTQVLIDLVKSITNIAGVIKDMSDSFADMTGISGSMQIKLLLLGKAMSVIWGIGTKLSITMGALALSSTRLSTGMAVAGIKVGIFTKIIVKARIAMRLLNKAMLANKIGVIIIAVTGLVALYKSLTSSTDELNDSIARSTKLIQQNGEVSSTTKEELVALDTVSRKAFSDFTQDQIKLTEKEIQRLSKAIEDQKESWFGNEEGIASNEKTLGELKGTLVKLIGTEKLLKEANKEAIKQADAKKAKLLAEVKAKEGLITKNKELGKSEKEAFNKASDALDNRVSKTQDTLIKLYDKEENHKDKLIELENKLTQARLTHANKRITMGVDLNSKLQMLDNKGLSDYKAYLNNQRRADEMYHKAIQALKLGNLELSKSYASEYSKLIAMNAGEELTREVEKRVWDSKTREFKIETITVVDLAQQKSINTAKANETKLYNLKLLHSNEDLKNIESLHAKEYARAMSKLKNTRQEIQLQLSYLKIMVKLQEVASGVKINADWSEFEKALLENEQNIKDLTDKERKVNLQIATNKSQAIAEIQEVEQVVEQEPIEKMMIIEIDGRVEETMADLMGVVSTPLVTQVDVDLKKATSDVEKFKGNQNEPIEWEAKVDLQTATQRLNDLRANAEQYTQAEHRVLVEQAMNDIRNLQALASQNTSNVHTTYYQSVPMGNQDGGLITPSIPKFKVGGHLENGLGHTRKTGNLGGYGGGDKIKALLEAGEFIIRKEAVKKLGLDRMHSLNQGVLPKFNVGGEVAPSTNFNMSNTVKNSTTSADKTVNLNLIVGGTKYPTIADETIANSLADHLERIEI